MLDIVITHYNEPWYICRKLFRSLDMQRIVNWAEITVTVVNDGGHEMPREELQGLSFPVTQVNIPKQGISAARNTGIEITKEPWIMFCDCDDSFTNIYALDEILTGLRTEKQADMVIGRCWTEFGRFVIDIPDERLMMFIHGKAYRRQFLEDTGLRFDESVSMGEDTKFNGEADLKGARMTELESRAPVYVWIRRGGSVTNRCTDK